jgi:iron complex outermembrane receptor protein
MNTLHTLRISAAPLVLGLAMVAGSAHAQQAPSITNGNAGSALASEAPAADTIVVTGSRIANPNLKALAPITTLNATDIKASGVSSAEELINQLPQVFAGQGSTVSNGATGTATVDLRGLGATRTLVLVNGRRLMPGDPGSSASDLNFIPTSLVKRVDVLTGGASATYGADAVAGVVNFVLDKDFTGFRFDIEDGLYNHYNGNREVQNLLNKRINAGLSGYNYPQGNTWDGNGYNGTLAYGAKFADGRGHVMAYVGHRHQNAVAQSQRDYSSCSINKAGTACGGSATANGANGLYYPAGSSSSTIGAFGNGTLTEGSSNLFNYAPTNYYQRNDNRWNAGLFGDVEVSSALHPYFEFMFMSDRTVAQIAPSGDFGNTLTINCDNPYLSSAQKSTICNSSNMVTGYTATGYPITALGDQSLISSAAGNANTAYLQLLWRNVYGQPRKSDLRHQSYRSVMGTRGDLGHGWAYDAYLQYGRTAYKQTYTGEVSVSRMANALNAVTNSSGNVVCASGSADGCSPINLFTGTPSAASLAYISATGVMTGYTSELVASAQLTGDLTQYGVKTPWADTGANIAIGTEFRREGLALHPDNAFITGDLAGQGGATLPIEGNYKVIEGIIEAQVPIIENKMNFNTGYRFSHYQLSTGRTYDTHTYKFGLDYTPVPDLRLRAGFNRSVRAPNLQELFATQHVALDGSTDPCADQSSISTSCALQGVTGSVASNPAGQYNGLVGGNPNLNPEVAYTKTLGVVLTPHQLRGFTISADYFNIRIDDAIQSYGADAILSACYNSASSSACSLINRASNGSLWMSSNGYVVDIPHNIGWIKDAGFDLNASYTHDLGRLGRLTASMNGTVLAQYAVNNGLTQAYDCAGYYGTTCGVPAPTWRHRARFALDTKRNLVVSLVWRYIGPVAVDYSNPSSTLHASSYSAYAAHIKPYSYFDLSVNGSVGSHVQWRAGVKNLLDKDPPLVGTGSCSSTYCNGNTYGGVYDSMGRYVFTGMTFSF